MAAAVAGAKSRMRQRRGLMTLALSLGRILPTTTVMLARHPLVVALAATVSSQ